MANNELKHGDIFDGRYEVDHMLGAGGFAQVYLVTTVGSQQRHPYALKLLKPGADVDAVRKFQTEAGMLLQHSIKHPHIVRGYVGDFHPGTNRQPYILMKYAPNGTVASTLKNIAPQGLPEAVAVGYIEQASYALQYLHNRQILHRDVKPENMLLDAKHQVLLSDFGIAISLHDTTDNVPIGTLPYMAPELWNQSSSIYSIYSDQFALAVATYVLLCGHGKYPFSTINDTRNRPPIPIKYQVQQYSALLAVLEPVIQKGLAKKEEDRFSSVSEYMRAIRYALNEVARQGHNPPVPPPTPKPVPPIPKPTPKPNPSPPAPNPEPPNPHHSHGITRRVFVVGAVGAAATLAAIGAYEGLTQAIPALIKSGKGPQYNPANNTPTQRPNHLPTQEGTTLYVHTNPEGYAGFNNVAWSPDGKRIALAETDGIVRVCDAISGENKFIYEGPPGDVKSVVWSRDGKRIVMGQEGGTVQAWNAADGSDRFTYQTSFDFSSENDMSPGTLVSSMTYINKVAWSTDGKRIAAAGVADYSRGAAYVWNAANGGGKVVYYGGSGVATDLVWSPDGKHIATSNSDGTVKIWNASNGKVVLTYDGYPSNARDPSIWSVAWSPDGKRMASANISLNSEGNNDSTLEVWSAINGGNRQKLPAGSGNINSVAWSPNGKYLVSASSTIDTWDTTTWRKKFSFGQGGYFAQWSPDGKYIASGGGDEVQIWVA